MRNSKERWNSSRNRKVFLLAFAKQMGFDPMVAANWRNQRYTLKGTAAVPICIILRNPLFYSSFSCKGASLLARYGGSLEVMIKDAFPELHFKDESTRLRTVICFPHGFFSDHFRYQEVTPFSTAREPGYWDDRNNRRQYLFSLAEKMRFDPMVEVNWKGKTLLIQANQVRILEYQQKEEGLIFTYITKIGCGTPCQIWKVVKSIAR